MLHQELMSIKIKSTHYENFGIILENNLSVMYYIQVAMYKTIINLIKNEFMSMQDGCQ